MALCENIVQGVNFRKQPGGSASIVTTVDIVATKLDITQNGIFMIIDDYSRLNRYSVLDRIEGIW